MTGERVNWDLYWEGEKNPYQEEIILVGMTQSTLFTESLNSLTDLTEQENDTKYKGPMLKQ